MGALRLLAQGERVQTSHLRVVQVLVTAWLFTGQSLLWPAPVGVPAQAWGVAEVLRVACQYAPAPAETHATERAAATASAEAAAAHSPL